MGIQIPTGINIINKQKNHLISKTLVIKSFKKLDIKPQDIALRKEN